MKRVKREIWKPLPVAPRYEVCIDGRVRLNGRLLKQSGVYGWTNIRVKKGRPRLYNSKAWLILCTYQREPEPGELARHLDDNPENNKLSNLAWGTKSDNALDAVKNGKHPTFGKHRTKRTKLKISLKMLGNENCLGLEHTPATCAKMSVSQKKRFETEDPGSMVITRDQRQDIIRRYNAGGILQRELAAEYGVTQVCISQIILGKRKKRSVE
jgi:hypothetical protein